jgi:hypothetical protein
MYETLARKRSSLQTQIDELLGLRDIERYRPFWNDQKFLEEKVSIGAEDGSFNYKKYKNFVLYAINAAAYLYDGSLKEIQASDINILYPYKNVEGRLRLYQSIFELKASLRAIENADIFLLDGSLLGELGTLRDIETWLTPDEREEVLGFLPELEESEEVEITSLRFAKGLEKFEKIAFLEYLEYLTTMGRLLEKGLEKLVGVSKSSTSTEFNEGISDMAIFEELTPASGYSRPSYMPLGVVPRRFPVYDELLNSLVFTTFYARLEDKKDVFMFETPREIDDKEIVDILNKIKSNCVEGYPYLLRKAHRKVVITNKDIQKLFTSIGITAKTGREMLER